MCQHLQDVQNSMNWYFPNDKFMVLQNHMWVSDPLKVQDRPVDVSVTEYKMLLI